MKNVLANLVLMAFGLLLGLLALEAGLRLAGFHPATARPDPILGFRYAAGVHYVHVGEEGKSEGRYNLGGWRDVEHPLARAPGTTRILILGDSYVAGFQVPLDSTFHRRLERDLATRAEPGHRFEVVAMGQDGNSTAGEYLTWRDYGRAYHPDVVAVLFVQNDPADNWRPFALDTQRPFFVEDGDSLRLDLSFTNDPGFRRAARRNWIRDHSALWLAARTAAARLQQKKTGPRVIGGQVQDGYYASWNFDRRVDPDTLTPFRITGKIYAKFAREVQASGAQFVVFHTGFGQQEDGASLALLEKDPNFDRNKSARWMLGLGERDGFPVVPLSPAFRAASRANGGKPLWFGHTGVYGHWNAPGHAVAAAAMARYFARTLPGLDTTGTTPADVPGLAELEKR